MAQMNRMEKRNFTNSARNGGKTAEMRNNSTKSGMVGMSASQHVQLLQCSPLAYIRMCPLPTVFMLQHLKATNINICISALHTSSETYRHSSSCAYCVTKCKY